MQDWPERERYTAEDLLQIIRILRDRENGCPWDKVQTHASIRKNFLEETCEALEAIDADDAAMMREELGDVLMQVAFHAVIEEERGRFDFEQVCREVCEKLVFRHPNIFASSAAENAGINSWDALKNKEKGRTTLADELNTVPATLPALMYAQKMQKRAAGYPAASPVRCRCPEGCRARLGGSGAGKCRRAGRGTAVCSGQCHAAGRCGRGRGPDLCIRAVPSGAAAKDRRFRRAGTPCHCLIEKAE